MLAAYLVGQPDPLVGQPDHQVGQPDHQIGQPDHQVGQPDHRVVILIGQNADQEGYLLYSILC